MQVEGKAIQKDYTIVKLNVGGKRFETLRSTLLSIEGTYFTGLIGDCENPSNEYFIDRDGEKFAPILNYLRGDRNTYIDPNEAAFYCLPNPSSSSTSFHELVHKDILFCREFLEKHQIDMINELKKQYQSVNYDHEFGSNIIEWTLFNGNDWNFNRDKQYMNYEYEMLQSFKVRTSLLAVFLNEVNLFWRPQGLLCTIFSKKIDNSYSRKWFISFQWNGTETQKSFEEVLFHYSYSGSLKVRNL